MKVLCTTIRSQNTGATIFLKNKILLICCLLWVAFGFQQSAIAQTQTCNYTLNLFDSFGDGWNGSVLTVTHDGVSTDYTLEDGSNGTFSFEVTEGLPIELSYSAGAFQFEVTYQMLNPDGLIIFSDGPNPTTGVVYSAPAVCPECPVLDTDLINFTNITFESATINWMGIDTVLSYNIEWGVAGFNLGEGMLETTSETSFTFDNLEEITSYDVYIYTTCSGGDGLAIGPFNFFTTFENPPQGCTYSLNLFDSFGDGWNGSVLTVTHNGVSTNYTFTTGNEAFFEFDVFEGLPIVLTYAAGSFQNEVTYELVDPNGIVVFEDGPSPTVGEVYSEDAICPDCPILDDDAVTFTNITFESATINWMGLDSALTYTLEWGLEGFVVGNGTIENTTATSFTFTDLAENTLYDVYLFANCANGQGVPIGPITFQTGFVDPPGMCFYTLELNFTGFSNSAWNGSKVSITHNNITTDYTLNGVDDNGDNATFNVPVLDGFDIELSYTQVGFNGFSINYSFFDSDGLLLYSAGPNPPAGLVYEAPATCPTCPAAAPAVNFTAQSITDTTANLVWAAVGASSSYIIEYGPTGFPQGAGLMVTSLVNVKQLTGLNPCVTYDAYVTVDCGNGDLSTTVGPLTFTTTYSIPPGAPGDTCTYSLDLMDTFGDGWNGSILNITHNGTTTPYTLNNINDDGSQATFELPFISNLPVVLNYSAGSFQNEVSYDLIDPDGNIVFTDGPFPAVGEVYNFVACPSCPGPIDGGMLDVNATNASVGWIASTAATGNFIVEYGTLGFTLGTGNIQTVSNSTTSANLTNLQENTWYDVYITLDCGTETSKSFGPISFQTIWLNDVGIGVIANPTSDSCNLSANETVTVGLRNYGQNPQSLFEYFFAVNGELAAVTPPTDGFFTGVVGNDSTILVDFEITYDFSAPGFYLIEAWTNMEGDSDTSNDTLSLEIVTAFPLPLREDFEANAIPDGWTTNGFLYADGAHNNPTIVVGRNLFVSGSTFNITTERYGPINDGDSLSFDYRYAVWSAGTVGQVIGENTLEVQVSDDCMETWTTIFTVDESNHVTSADMATRFVDLSAYAGQALNIRLLATYASGDYWLDIDNINILGCPQNFGLQATIDNPSVGVGNDGSIVVTPTFGTAPYQYNWSNGGTGATQSGLTEGEYIVTVTDADGCQDVRGYILDEVVSTSEVPAIDNILLSPNPTSGRATLKIDLNRTVDVDLQIFSVTGQLLQTVAQKQVNTLNHDFDLSSEAAGMYFVRILIDGQSHYERLVLTK